MASFLSAVATTAWPGAPDLERWRAIGRAEAIGEQLERIPGRRGDAARLRWLAERAEQEALEDQGQELPAWLAPQPRSRTFRSAFATASVRLDSSRRESTPAPRPIPQGARVRNGVVMTGRGAWRL
jgi:hypothetical protein